MTRRRRIAVVSSARSDFGLLLPLIRAIERDPALELTVLASGAHFSRPAGYTIDEVRSAELGEALVEIEPTSPAPRSEQHAAARAFADELLGFSAHFDGERRPDIVVIIGDRYDALPAAVAALPFNIAVVHISGGEITEGAIDDAVRHALTKLSHLHFPAHERAAARIRAMGEAPWRIEAVGEPGLDALAALAVPPRADVLAPLALDAARPVTVVTYHPETLAGFDAARGAAAILAAAAQVDTQIVLTHPNGDPGSAAIVGAIADFAAAHPDRCAVRPSLGRVRYLELLAHADCMVGNSSSGIIEAPSLAVPVVNVGDRQRGRLRGANVTDVDHDPKAIADAWRAALGCDRAALRAAPNPYGDGRASQRIVARLRAVPLDRRLLRKRYDGRDAPAAPPTAPATTTTTATTTTPARDTVAVLMAGGRGERLRPHTETLPKPMLAVGGKPLLETLVEQLVAHGFSRMIISLGHRADAIRQHFSDGARWAARIGYVDEPHPLGTAGALGRLADRDARAPLLVINGDLLARVDYGELLAQHRQSGAAATVCVVERPNPAPYGVVTLDARGRVQRITEKSREALLVNAGMYVIEPAVRALVGADEPIDMPDLLQRALDRGLDVGSYRLRDTWIDVATADDLERARDAFPRVFSR